MKKKYSVVILSLAALLALAAVFGIGKAVGAKKSIDYKDIIPDSYFSGETYVIGHKSPDTDTVCSAIACARLLNDSMSANCIPVVSGKINNETKFVLNYFGIEIPETLENATDKNIVMVDHSTFTQSIDGMEDANILGLFDHHGLGDVKTASPVLIRDMPVGSTATILYTSFVESNTEIDKQTAGLIVSAILSDTFNLTGITTTEIDKEAVKVLSKKAGLTDLDSFYAEMEKAAASYEGMTDVEILRSDYKEYDMSGAMVAIGCVNASNEKETNEMADRMRSAMASIYDDQECGHLYVLIRNAELNETLMICYGDGADIVMEKAFGSADHVFQPSATRKKHVVPALEAVYKDLAS